MFDYIKHHIVELRFFSFSNEPFINAFYHQRDQDSEGATKTVDELLKIIDKKFVNSYVDEENSFYFKHLWSSRRFTDFIVVVEKNEFKVHKNVLGMKSAVFAAMFENDMEESKSGKVTINDFSADAVEEFLQFLYTGDIPDETNAMEVFALASKYDVKTLKLKMEETNAMNIDSDNAIEVLKLGNLYDSEDLKMDAYDELKFENPAIELSDLMKNEHENIVKLLESKHLGDKNI